MMTPIDDKTLASLERAQTRLSRYAAGFATPEVFRLDVKLEPADLVDALRLLSDAKWGMLASITALDLGVESGLMEVLYHLCEGAAILTLRVTIPRQTPEIPSACAIYPSASFFERELMEMFGVAVIGTPNTDRLFLPDDWPQGVYPLRKDFNAEEVDR